MPKKEVRLIDANALDTLLEDVEKGYKKNFLFKSAKELRWIRDAISALRTIDPESLRSQWRNAETNPPQEPGEYIVMIKGGANATSLLFDGRLWYEETEPYWYEIHKVTHWMPLPEPPEESKDPFYNEANQNRLNKTIAAYENGEE